MSDASRSVERTKEVFLAFLLLGLTSFGGPIAHLGYFRSEFVERRRWLTEQTYADLVALCQFLPGPASSQVGFTLGLMRAGPWGAAAAWTAFTLPSAIVLVLFAMGAAKLDGPVSQGIIHGLKVTAVAIVAHAVWGMARSLCPDRRRAGIALAAVFTVMLVNGPLGQVTAIVIGALAGMVLCRSHAETDVRELVLPVSARAGYLAGGVFVILLLGLPLLAWASPSAALAVMDAFYRAGALVFGGGHVVLPLLEAEVVQSGWVSADEFLTGYGAAQAVPGPLFTFSSYLGAVMTPLGGSLFGAALALVMLFLPGMLLLVAVLPHWNRFRRWDSAQALMRGANAAVVGVLGAALYQPVWTSAILGPHEFALALSGFLLLGVWKLPAWVVVVILAGGGVLITL
ncbi:chromate efflux transporter [Halomonas eurihalina]|uniref:Chromate efflux transporter n=1 Tax=Halomonas eurihalina TaxID=42566 RepID=A0A5D9DBN3_HALER|nr:chromate efflux transporter [Halomonas eurihalina]MDR5860725.1 chromate efflux transporter [Halomonas eurihalina]TZG40055.1 chromate efflux transporter [Halomonas eurihalina]